MAGISTCWSFLRKSVAGGSAADRNSAGSANAALYTSSTAETPLSSFGAVRRPSNTHGRCSGHLELASCALKAAFSCPCVLSTIPLDCGWKAVVCTCLIPSSLVRLAHREEVNWWPWSEVGMDGTPNLATQDEMRASTQSSAAMDFKRAASNHLDDLFTMVNRYLKPSADAGSGPTRTTCTWVKRLSAIGMAWTGAVCFGLALPCAQSWQSRHHADTSEDMPRQTTWAAINRRVARMPAWASLWTALKTSRRSDTGMMGLGWPVETSQTTFSPCISM